MAVAALAAASTAFASLGAATTAPVSPYSYTGWCATPNPEACPSPFNPYRRPPFLQPARVLSDLAYAAFEVWLQSEGTPLPKLGVDIEVRQSGAKGNGLFALRPFEEGEVVARYSGTRATYTEFMAAWEAGLTSGDYLAVSYGSGDGEGDDAQYVDATDASASAIGRYANHNVRKQNAQLCSSDEFGFGLEFIMTTKAVPAGGEILLDYGREYWDCKLGVWPTPQRLAVDFA
jgi:hypothetical protein